MAKVAHYAGSLHSCPTPCNPVDCSRPGSSVHDGTLQARILEWVPFASQGIFPTQGSNPLLLCLPQGLAGFSPIESSGKHWQRLTLSFFFQQAFLNKLAVFNSTGKKNWFCTSKEKKRIHLNQFSPESKQYHGHPASKKLSFLSIVIALWLQYRSNSAQIDCDNRARRIDKNLGMSLQGVGDLSSEESKGVNKLASVGEPELPLPAQRLGQLEGDQLMEKETEGLGGV